MKKKILGDPEKNLFICSRPKMENEKSDRKIFENIANVLRTEDPQALRRPPWRDSQPCGRDS